MGAGIAFIGLLALGAVVAWLLISALTATGGFALGHGGTTTNRPDPSRELRYLVPDGQDPAAVMTALKVSGYDAALEEPDGRRIVDIVCPQGKERDRDGVREVIASTGITAESTQRAGLGLPIRFLDETAA